MVELETDKVSVEAPAPVSGVLLEIVAEEGDTVEVNALLGRIEAGAAASAPAPQAAASAPAAAPASSGGGEEIEVRVPESGESVTEADVGEWLKKEGDAVALDEPIVSLETDKAAMDVPAPAAGVLTKIAVQEGDTVEVGALLRRHYGRRRGRRAYERRGRRAFARASPRREPRARGRLMLRCRRPRAGSSPSAASIPRPFRAPARTGASPRATPSPCRARRLRLARRPRPPRRETSGLARSG